MKAKQAGGAAIDEKRIARAARGAIGTGAASR
jgi:hypothetical protein